jgi:hypothetical protein
LISLDQQKKWIQHLLYRTTITCSLCEMTMPRRLLHEFLALALAVLSMSLSAQLLWFSSSSLGSGRNNSYSMTVGTPRFLHPLGSIVGFATVATAASFAPQSSSSSTLVHTVEKSKKSASSASSATCLQASTSSSSFLEKKDDDESSSSCSNNDQSLLITDSASSSRSRKMSKNDLSNYHLIWSPGALKKMAITTFFLLVIPRLAPQSWKPSTGGFLATVTGGTSSAASSSSTHCHAAPSATTASTLLSFWGRNFALPLAASSCCLLQLGLNLVSFGCAGWNSVLGPVRPYFLSVLLYTFIIQQRRPLLSYVWQALIALLPEMVHLYNKYSAPAPSSSKFPALENELLHQVDIELDIKSMGCAACIASINHALRQQNHVISAWSELKPFGAKGGTASIRLGVSSPNDVAEHIQALIQAVAKTGFDGATTTSVRTSSQKEATDGYSS